MRNRQRGMTMWSAMYVIGTLSFFMFLGFKMFSPYMEDKNIKNALAGLARDPNVASWTKADMVASLEKRFDTNYVTGVKPNQLKVEKRGTKQVLSFEYEVVVPLFYNISLLFDFNHKYEVAAVE